MASSIIAMGKMPSLPALKRQRLLAEFAALKQASPPGVFVSLTPGDPSLWSGVIFVRHGPYATAVLRFQISFPDAYPSLPPLVTFATDMFHPLITPLTTYMYTTDVQEGGTVSATDDERLPPGGFSLRHGFPGWFGRGRNNRTREREREREREGTPPPLPPRRGSGIVTAIATATATGSGAMTPPPVPHISSIQEVQSNTGTGGGVVAVGSITGATPGSVTSSATAVTAATTTGAVASGFKRTRREVSTYEVLGYIRSTFDDSDVLDSIPLEAAGNPGAWHAWRAHRRALERKTSPPPVSGMESGTTTTAVPSEAGSVVTSPTVSTEKLLPATPRVATPTARRPEEWNWEGVWQERVKRGIATSLSEAVLFGGAGMADDVINFLNMDETEVDETKKNLLRTLGAVA